MLYSPHPFPVCPASASSRSRRRIRPASRRCAKQNLLQSVKPVEYAGTRFKSRLLSFGFYRIVPFGLGYVRWLVGGWGLVPAAAAALKTFQVSETWKVCAPTAPTGATFKPRLPSSKRHALLGVCISRKSPNATCHAEAVGEASGFGVSRHDATAQRVCFS